MPLVTVLIPTYDHADTIRYAIASVQAQTVQDFELLVVGDGAPPRTDAIVEELRAADSRIRYFPNPKGEGNGEIHRANALKQARGALVCYLGDDDLWLPNHLEVMVSVLASADFAHTNQVNVRPDGSLTVLPGDLKAEGTRRRMLEQKWNFFGPSCAGHTLAAYRKLPAGWRVRPEGIWSDLYMWRQWLEQPWCRLHTEPALTMLHFATPERKTWLLAERVEEMERWWERIRQPDFPAWIERQRLQEWQRTSERPMVYHQLGNLLQKHGELEQAEDFYRKAIDAYGGNAEYYAQLSLVLMKRDALGEAIATATTAVDLAKERLHLRHHRGNLLSMAGRWEEAAAAYAGALALDDTVALLHHQRGRCLEQMNRLEEAREHARKAADLEPENPHFKKNLERLQSLG